MSDAAKSPAAGNRMHGVNLYAQQLAMHARPPMAYGIHQAQLDAQQMHVAMMNNNLALQQMQQAQQAQQVRNLQRVAAAADWPRHEVPQPPAVDMDPYLQLQQPDPFAGGIYPQGQHAPFDPMIRRPQLNFPPPIPRAGVPFPAFGDQPQQNRVNERGRFAAEPRRRDRDRAR